MNLAEKLRDHHHLHLFSSLLITQQPDKRCSFGLLRGCGKTFKKTKEDISDKSKPKCGIIPPRTKSDETFGYVGGNFLAVIFFLISRCFWLSAKKKKTKQKRDGLGTNLKFIVTVFLCDLC